MTEPEEEEPLTLYPSIWLGGKPFPYRPPPVMPWRWRARRAWRRNAWWILPPAAFSFAFAGGWILAEIFR